MRYFESYKKIDKKKSKVLNAKFYKVNKYVYYYKMAFEKNFTYKRHFMAQVIVENFISSY